MRDDDFMEIVVYGSHDMVVKRTRMMAVAARRLGGHAWVSRRRDGVVWHEADVRVSGLSPAAAETFRMAFGVTRLDVRPYDMRRR